MTITSPSVDQVEDWNIAAIEDRASSALQYYTTPNTAPYLSLSTLCRSIPEFSPLDNFVHTFYFTDNDYGDYYKDIQLDYDHQYFYYDTTKKQVRVKKDLFHEVGTRYHCYWYTVWAEDSCYNRVTGTVTISTYNVALYISNLDGAVNISESMTTGEVFNLDMSDPDNDVFTWEIRDVTPNTNIFYLDDTKIMLVNGTVLDTSMLQYAIRIRTDDGTTYGRRTLTLTVNVIVTPVLQPRDSAWTTWNNWHDCTRTCARGYRVRYRTCTNPSRNYFGSDRSCEDSIDNEWERCNVTHKYVNTLVRHAVATILNHLVIFTILTELLIQ